MTIKIHITDYRNESTTHLKGEHFEKNYRDRFIGTYRLGSLAVTASQSNGCT